MNTNNSASPIIGTKIVEIDGALHIVTIYAPVAPKEKKKKKRLRVWGWLAADALRNQ